MNGKHCILIVENDSIEQDLLKEILNPTYNITAVNDGEEAKDYFAERGETTSLVLLDMYLPRFSGFELLAWRAERQELLDIPFICITGSHDPKLEMQVFNLGAEDFILKPYSAEVVLARVETHIKLKEQRDQLAGVLRESLRKIDDLHSSILTTLTNVTEYRSHTQVDKGKRTQEITALIVRNIKDKPWFREHYGSKEANAIIKSSVLYDIGKVGIADNFLLKPSKLTAEEFEEIKKHTVIGESIAAQFFSTHDPMFLSFCKEVCRSHHEWWDGSGYPDGLAGEEIPLSARILAVVDVIDALLGDRVYNRAYSLKEALEIIDQEAERHFDMRIVNTLHEVKDDIAKLYAKI